MCGVQYNRTLLQPCVGFASLAADGPRVGCPRKTRLSGIKNKHMSIQHNREFRTQYWLGKHFLDSIIVFLHFFLLSVLFRRSVVPQGFFTLRIFFLERIWCPTSTPFFSVSVVPQPSFLSFFKRLGVLQPSFLSLLVFWDDWLYIYLYIYILPATNCPFCLFVFCTRSGVPRPSFLVLFAS